MNLNEVVFVDGNSYTMSSGRTVIEYTCKDEWLYEVRTFVNKKLTNKSDAKSDGIPMCTFKDLADNMRCHAGYPENNEGMTVKCVETGETVFEGPKKKK